MTSVIKIRRGYVGAAGRQVHYRIAGSGPPLVLFHQSPRSSAEYILLIERWASDFTVIAPDTPGYGSSDPLSQSQTPEMTDFAGAMVAFLDDLGLERAAFYGFHTGASLSVALAAQAPEKIAVAVANGFAVLDDDERGDFLEHYLPPFEPEWDGSHLAWLWARLREQVIFFPWYDKRNETRMIYPMRDLPQLDEQVLDMLWAGDPYRWAYRAALSFDKSAALSQVKGPLTIMAAPPDPLTSHLDRLGELPPGVTVERPGDPEAAINRAREILPGAALKPFDAMVSQPRRGDGILRGFVDIADGDAQLHYRRAGKPNGESVVLLHDLYSASRVLTGEIAHLSQSYDVVAPDLPGHGFSDELPPGVEATPSAYADRLGEAVAALCPGGVKIVAAGLSAGVAVEMARRLGDKVSRIILVDSHYPTVGYREDFAAGYLPDLTPNAHGGHLLAGWRFARSQALFWPWFREEIPGIRPIDSDIEPGKTHQRFVALWENQARHKQVSPLFLVSPDEGDLDSLPILWVNATWADGMADMAEPWQASGARALTYGDDKERLAALVDALSGA